MVKIHEHIPSGYKPSPLGPIPEDWEVKRLGEIGSFKNGLNFTPNEDGFSYHFLGVGNFQDKTDIHANELNQIRLENELDKDYHLKDDDLVFVRSNGSKSLVGRCIIIHADHVKATYSGFCIRFRTTSEETSTQYIKHIIDAGYLQRFLQYEGRGTNITNLNQEILGRLTFPLPNLKEQQNILNVLSLWDTAIAKQTALIEQLTLRKRGLMQQLLTGKKRLKGFERGNFHRLGNYISECNRRNVGCNRVLSVTNTRGFILQEEQFDKIVASNDTSNYKVVRRGEFAYNPSRVNVGSLAMLKEYDEGILSPMYIVFKANENIDKTYLLQCLQSWWFRGHIPAYTQGSVRDSLSFDGLCSMKFYIPTLQEQKAISAILERADKEIEIQKQKLAAMQEQKKGLMQVLLTGKKRINTI